jgi:hypothetical protein
VLPADGVKEQVSHDRKAAPKPETRPVCCRRTGEAALERAAGLGSRPAAAVPGCERAASSCLVAASRSASARFTASCSIAFSEPSASTCSGAAATQKGSTSETQHLRKPDLGFSLCSRHWAPAHTEGSTGCSWCGSGLLIMWRVHACQQQPLERVSQQGPAAAPGPGPPPAGCAAGCGRALRILDSACACGICSGSTASRCRGLAGRVACR